MANTIGWGQGSANNTNQWGRGSTNNSISWGSIYGLSPSGDTNIIGGLQPTFELKYDLITTDFTFTRASFGTRVNEFGLIETVTDLGSNLIQNGSFDELGSEQVTNGDFATDISGWTKGSGTTNPISWDSGKMKVTNDVALLNSARQSITTVIGKTYLVTADVDSTNGVNPRLATSNPTTAIIGTGGTIETLSYTFVATSTFSEINLYNWQNTLGAYNLWDNVSVKQVDPNNEWTIEALWTIQDGVASGNGATGGTEELNQNISSSGILIGSTVRGSFEIKNYVSGSVQVIGISNTVSRSGNGIYEFQGDITSFNIRFRGASFYGDITNVSVQEVLEDDVPRIDYTGSTFDVAVLGNELIDYSAISSPSSSWSLVNGKWFFDDTTSGFLLTEAFDVVVGEQYEITVDVSIASGNANFRVTSGNGQTRVFNYTDFPNGVTKFITTVVGVDGAVNRIYAPINLVDNPFTLNSISIKKVTAYTTTDKGAFLLEPISTNLIDYSEDFSDSSWNNSNISEELSSVLSPNGTSYSYKLTNDAVTGNHFLRDTITVTSGEAYTLSLFIKKGTRDIVSIADGFNINVLANFDLTNGSVTNVAATSSSIEDFGNGWYRCMATITPSNTNLGLMIFSGTVYAGKDESGDFYVWGAHVEELPYATSYIPTSGTTVTRAQESSVKNNVNGLFDDNVGSIYLAYDGVLTSGTTLNNMNPFRLYGQGSNRIRLYYTLDADFLGSSVDFENGGKIAWSCNGTTILTYINGALVDTHTITSNFTTLTNFILSTPFMTHRINDIKIYDKALTDDELINLTTI